jgi:hypothetical protein
VEILPCLCGRVFNVTKLKACPACGRSSGYVRSVTTEQRQQARREREEARRERHTELEREREEAKLQREREVQLIQEERIARARQQEDDYVEAALIRIRRAVQEGRPASLFRTHFIGAPYTVFGQMGGSPLQAGELAEFGWDGWEVVGSVPATTGIPLTNSSGQIQTYAGGIGGLVEGIHLLLRLEVTSELLNSRPEFIDAFLREEYAVRRSTKASEPSAITIRPGQAPPQSGGGGGGGFVAFGYSRTVITESDGGDGDDGGGDFDF